MATHKKASAATLKTGAGNVLRFSLAALPLFPAIKINLDAAAGQGETWAVVGIGFVIFGALCHRAQPSRRSPEPARRYRALWGCPRRGLPWAQRHERHRQSRQPYRPLAR